MVTEEALPARSQVRTFKVVVPMAEYDLLDQAGEAHVGSDGVPFNCSVKRTVTAVVGLPWSAPAAQVTATEFWYVPVPGAQEAKAGAVLSTMTATDGAEVEVRVALSRATIW